MLPEIAPRRIPTTFETAPLRKTEANLRKARQQEAEYGARLQKELLFGEVPDRFGSFQLASIVNSAKVIAGDLVAFTDLGGGTSEVVIGDVMGKGMAAALLGAGLKTVYRKILAERAVLSASGPGASVAEVYGKLREKTFDSFSENDAFIALIMLRVSAASGEFAWVNAGMPPALVYSARTGEISELGAELAPLGIIRSDTVTVRSNAFAPGDAVLLYSDGILEESFGHELYGLERLRHAFRRAASEHLEPGPCLAAIREDIEAFAGDKSPDDDQTAILIRFG